MMHRIRSLNQLNFDKYSICVVFNIFVGFSSRSDVCKVPLLLMFCVYLSYEVSLLRRIWSSEGKTLYFYIICDRSYMVQKAFDTYILEKHWTRLVNNILYRINTSWIGNKDFSNDSSLGQLLQMHEIFSVS